MLYKFRIRKNTGPGPGPGPAPPEKLAYFFLVLIYMKIFENIYIIYRNKIYIYMIFQKIFIKLIKISPFFVVLLLFSLSIKNPLLCYIYTYCSEFNCGLIICIIFNIFIVKLLKKFFLLFKLNERIISFFRIIYNFFIYYRPVSYKPLYSIIFIPFMSS